MTFNGATMLLVRGLGVALLMLVNATYLFELLGAEMGIYLAYKVLMGDFYHWLPVDGFAGFVLSLWMRVSIKVIADFTAVVQFRGPGEMGGFYFTVNNVMGFVFCFAAIKIFFASDVSEASRLNEGIALKALFGLLVFWALNAALGVSMMKKEYRKTFVSLELGCEWAQKFFLEGETDEVKSVTLKLNKKKWEPVEKPVKEWVQENWWTWKEEKPGWFTDAWIAKVPDDFIPAKEDRVVPQKIRRKCSIFGGGDEKNRRLSLGVGGTATIVPVAGGAAEGVDVEGSAKVDGLLKAPGEGGAGADELGAAGKINSEVWGVKIDGSAVSANAEDGISGEHRAWGEKKKTTKVSEKRAVGKAD
jgi:hypothetical protein